MNFVSKNYFQTYTSSLALSILAGLLALVVFRLWSLAILFTSGSVTASEPKLAIVGSSTFTSEPGLLVCWA